MKFTKALFALAVTPAVVLATSQGGGNSGTLVGPDAPAHCECESLMASVCPNNNFQFPNQFENTLKGLSTLCFDDFCPNNAKHLNCDKDDSCQCMANSADIPNGPGEKSDCNGERTCNCGSGDVGYNRDQDGGHCTSGPNTCNFNTGLIGTDNGDNNVCNHREACNCNDGQIQDKSCDGEQSCNYNSGYIGTTNLDNTVCNGFKSCNYNCGRYRVCPGDEDRNLPGQLGMGVITGYCNGERSCNGNQGVIRGISTCNSERSCNCNQGYISGGCNGKNTCNAVPYCIEIKGGCEDENSCNFIGATDSCCESESAAASCISQYCRKGNCEYVDCPDPIEEELSTPAPIAPRGTPAPVGSPGCSMDMGNLGTDMCPDTNIVKSLDVKGPAPPSDDIIFGLEFAGTASNPLVKFKVDNPFTNNADIYVEYHEDVGSVAGAFDAICTRELLVPGCNPNASTITAACLAPEGKTPFSVVRIYFVSNDSALGNGSDAVIPECCDEQERGVGSGNGWQVVEYTYEIMCGC